LQVQQESLREVSVADAKPLEVKPQKRRSVWTADV
jgi:hypothetical protein